MTETAVTAMLLAAAALFGVVVVLIVAAVRGVLHKKALSFPKCAAVWAASSAGISVTAAAALSLVYYRAEDGAYTYLESGGAVSVTKEDGAYFFDGPGEDAAVIFYPGALVQTEAYSRLMYTLAENGLDTFLVDMPFRIAFFGINRAEKIMNTHNYDRWFMSGHSLGGSIAAIYCSQNPDGIDGLIFLASYPSVKLDPELPVLSIYGTNDEIVSKRRFEENRKFYSDHTAEIPIEGGNHSQFGSYGRQLNDGEPGISSDAQKEIAAREILKYCL